MLQRFKAKTYFVFVRNSKKNIISEYKEPLILLKKNQISFPDMIDPEDTEDDISHIVLNFSYIDHKSIMNYNHSNWPFIFNSMIKYDSMKLTNRILFDYYLDETFVFKRDEYIAASIIPYVCPWIGIFHNGPGALVDIVSDTVFIQSLATCKGIIVMSEYLKKWFDNIFGDLGIKVKVNYIMSPVEMVISEQNMFSVELFRRNHKKRIGQMPQIGGWQRDHYMIYAIDLDKSIQKTIFQGPNVEYYAKPEKFDYKLMIFGYISEMEIKPDGYIFGMLAELDRKHKDVVICPYPSTKEFDGFLRENILFMNFADSSASDIVLSCLVRGTPIVVNKLDAVMEYLGGDYPLYYDDLHHASYLVDKLLDPKNSLLEQTVEYLVNHFSKIRKKLDINSFIVAIGEIHENAQKASGFAYIKN
ncbi:MAG: putative WcaK-like polysaccharide pyruvyl transferase [Harvfovirus sp.]|uniref:Putative WcaK-like polysaccharide pyruvyl transferase n=1 Tax=Harvfovirus sp. TaxID=2487768 RepID=A0A3G5A7J3_9VIRU|nr:MAG: putative WcaK-like polysaccharide pyruvyl transferase [Harvfovirus sp.]